MTKKQNGFSPVEVLVVILIISFVVLVGLAVWNSMLRTSPVVNDTPAITEPVVTDNRIPYEGYGLSFKYPADWKLDDRKSSQSSGTYLTSPDYTETSGARITVDGIVSIHSGVTAENYKAKVLDANPQAGTYKDFKILTVDGKKAVQYYQGDSRQTIFFVANGGMVGFTLDTFPVRDSTSATYDSVVESVIIK